MDANSKRCSGYLQWLCIGYVTFDVCILLITASRMVYVVLFLFWVDYTEGF